MGEAPESLIEGGRVFISVPLGPFGSKKQATRWIRDLYIDRHFYFRTLEAGGLWHVYLLKKEVEKQRGKGGERPIEGVGEL